MRAQAVLDGEWRVRPIDERAGDWPVPAEVPGCVHTDLMRAGVLDDPLAGDGEQTQHWIGATAWRYETEVDLTADLLERDRLELVFDGLDTFATVRLDDAVVLTSENMHRRYRVTLPADLAAGPHRLSVDFEGAETVASRRRAEWGEFPGAYATPYNYARKMACNWGWDWGPTVVTAGIWREARVEAWDRARFADVRPTITVADEGGRVDITVALERCRPDALRLRAVLSAPDGTCVAASDGGAGVDSAALSLDAGPVERWWPHGLGAQPLYRLDVDLLDDAGAVVDRWSRRIGFRTLELDQTDGAFTLVVNGRPLFARGVNWVPDDAFVSRVERPRLLERLASARDAGANLVRVWGGGVYESDAFYDTCDELGLLVWQDFLFACATYPEEHLRDEVAAEARDNVARLRHHPSLALWCGNNENIWLVLDGCWDAELDRRPWGLGLYHDVLPTAVAETDPGRPYIPGSPFSSTPDVHPNSDDEGPAHLWKVWNERDYRHYRDHVPRFAAEFGWQAPATHRTLSDAIGTPNLTPTSAAMAHRQKATDGMGKLSRGLAPFLDEPDDVDPWLWAMQLNQARAVTTGIEHLRSHRGRCMGAIWWQLNDDWPAISWAVVDHAGRRKPAWYALRRAFASRLLTIQPRDGRPTVFVVNDTAAPWAGSVIVERIGFDGTTVASTTTGASADAGTLAAVPLPEALVSPDDPARELLVASIGEQRSFWYFAVDRDLDYPVPRLATEEVRATDTGAVLTVRAGSFVRDLTLFVDRLAPDAVVDDGLVTLLPGERTTFTIEGIDAERAATLLEPPNVGTANALG